jgi:hypothetical protein
VSAEHYVEAEMRPGRVLSEVVCTDHLASARDRGYRRRGPAEDAMEADGPVTDGPADVSWGRV